MIKRILGVFHLQKISQNFYRELPFGKSAFDLSQVPFEGAEGGLANQKVVFHLHPNWNFRKFTSTGVHCENGRACAVTNASKDVRHHVIM